MLKSVGAGGHYPTNKLQAEDGDLAANAEVQKSWLTSLVDRTVGRVQALAETTIFAFYKVTHCGQPSISNRSTPLFLHLIERDMNTDLALACCPVWVGSALEWCVRGQSVLAGGH